MRPKVAALITGAALTAQTAALTPAVAVDGGGPSFVEAAASPLTFPNGGGVAGIAHGDFNGDGREDLAVTQSTNIGGVGARGYISIMLGLGDGTVGSPDHIALPDSPTVAQGAGIVAADLVDDAAIDLAVASPELTAILVYAGNGDGTFAAPTTLETTAAPVGLTSGDLDGSGKADLATYYSGTNSAGVLLNGAAGFSEVQDYPVATNPQAIAIANLDAGPGADLLVGTYDSKSLDALLNNGDGSFADAVSSTARVQVSGLWTGDFNNDGTTDTVVSGFAPDGGSPPCFSNCVQFVAGNGDGTFAPATDTDIYAVEDYPSIHYSETMATDLNGDGRPDVIFAHESVNSITVGYSSSDGSLEMTEFVASPGPGFVTDYPDSTRSVSVAAADLNGDGKPDLAVSHAGTNARPGGVSLLMGGGTAGFQAPRSYRTLRRWADPRSAALADFNNDGALDAVAITDALDFVPGNGDGTFGEATVALERISGPGEFYNSLRAADFDQDGNLDVAWAATDGVQGGPSPRNLVAFGTGGGAFGTVIALPPRVSDWAGRNLVLGDFDGDGYTDIAVWTKAQFGSVGEIDLYYYNPETPRTFTIGPVLSLGGTNLFPGFGLTAADLNKDGNLDLVTHMAAGGDSAGEQLFVFLGTGGGGFAEPLVTSPGLPDVQDLTTADVNGDGKLDLIGAGSNQVDVLLGGGDGTFGETVAYGAGISAGFVTAADIDGDGALDLAVGHFGCTCSNGFGVLPGEGDGTFGEYTGFAVGGGSLSSLALADLTGDGKLDVVAGHAGNVTAQITVLFNDSVPVAKTHERTITLRLKGHLVAKGTVSVADGTAACVDNVSVVIQRKKGDGWKKVAKTKTKAASDGVSAYKVTIPDKPGRYRAKVPKVVLGDSSTCTSDRSPTRKN